jgi:hypothetical protein
LSIKSVLNVANLEAAAETAALQLSDAAFKADTE